MEILITLFFSINGLKRKILNSALSVIVVISLVSLLSYSSGNDRGNGTIASNNFTIYKVDISNFAFSPQTLSAQIGDKVV